MSSNPQRAPADIVDGVLTNLVRRVLALLPEHQENLLARGLSITEIGRKGYVSAPITRGERGRAADAVAPYLEAFGGGVPGFYRERGGWRMVYRPPGFFIPVRDEWGRIRALTQRVDEPRDGGRYIWLSSADRDGGASSGAPPHFAARHLMHDAGEVTITEGSLKAEIVASISGMPVVGVAGTHSTAGLAERLKANFPKLRRVFVAYDRDFVDKPNVRDALFKLAAQFEAAGFVVLVRVWPGPEKGLDDYLLSVLRGREVRTA
ncbi:MAG: DUF3854 domain-containing protein [Acidobacteria bacterium]|nr:DUF3854 domain-containing protein [Acidobacteriota bacterium]